MSGLEYAKDKIMMGAERKTAVISPDTLKCTAFHEVSYSVLCCHWCCYSCWYCMLIFDTLSDMPPLDLTRDSVVVTARHVSVVQ